MSLIFPKKEILYAPMLGTLGGGSARGWGRGKGRFFAYAFSNHTFTPAGATGRYGPNLNDCQTAYNGTSWVSNPAWFKMDSYQGTQQWVVPEDGTYRIRCKGAQGGRVTTKSVSYGGYGAIAQGEFVLEGGRFLNIIVGQQGGTPQQNNTSTDVAAGGGGGSFVWFEDDATDCLVAAGGGGGQTDQDANTTRHTNFHATRNSTGMTGSSDNSPNGRSGAEGGTNGNGGRTADQANNSDTAGAGGGFFTSGETFSSPSNVWGIAAIDGGFGGDTGRNSSAINGSNNNRYGGFGGGGGGEGWYGCSGAGGGYSGGGSGRDSDRTVGGGGGSYVSTALGGTNASLTDFYFQGSGGSNQGDGSVVITKIA